MIHTDSFHPLSMVYRLYGPQSFDLARGAPLLRFFSIPRALLGATMLEGEP